MSAWLVTKAHIDGIVQSLVTEGIVPMDQATATGIMLWTENWKSLKARYGETVPEEAVLDNGKPYVWTGIEAPLDPQRVVRAIACYDYQSCEHNAWPESESYRLVNQLYKILFEKHSIESTGEGKWGMDTLEDFLPPAPT